MSLTFEKKPLMLGLYGGSMIAAGVVAMNVIPDNMIQKITGFPLFSTGWLLVIMSFIQNDTRLEKYKYPLVVSSLGVYGAAISSRMMMDSGINGTPVMISKMIFMAAWVSIGILIGMKKHGNDKQEEVHDLKIHGLGLIPPLMVASSMGIVNSFERPRRISSGPGMPIFMLAWVILTLVNSVKLESHKDGE